MTTYYFPKSWDIVEALNWLRYRISGKILNIGEANSQTTISIEWIRTLTMSENYDIVKECLNIDNEQPENW